MDPNHNKSHHDPMQNLQQEDDDADALLASLEEEDDSAYRAQRMQELRDAPAGTGTTATLDTLKNDYITLTSDDETLNFTTEHERAVVHFFHPDFSRCNTMDDHCRVIADKHAEYGNADVSFARVDVKNCPFVVEKLGVRVLPCVIGFVKGVVKGRVTGFEGLCWDGNERSMSVTKAVEETFVSWSVLRKRLLLGHSDDSGDDDDDDVRDRKSTRRGISGRKQQAEDEDDDWD
ncbi:hypothetical protein LTR99_002166 [Exophiala xenobiotica]|uniref:Thioredoxin domain-containing protein n=1 Tax=Vermiconidia calcicola TaxID=1690605 RepID=A0AAV9QKK6_9PEZI|nr:hypothetical protein LTR92_004580 [Exophiala xenobiotica]KAK5539137.1 hypothetical protein LTR23_006751 [Chaetothyriales sp. CCFEE 6169]KAK5542495.1 hypothetical protein LTR25_002381 [Vermiconidia calcicola]KAK5226055.1 hypothetical protein LTR72_003959 [Exophiala xenobiotica]KAK5272770.1 hypothetical protein LTR96_002401 [Exophiala xenobiotica]